MNTYTGMGPFQAIVMTLTGMIILTCIMIVNLTGCTYTITMVHTTGAASDVVDETETPSATVSPTISIPAAAI